MYVIEARLRLWTPLRVEPGESVARPVEGHAKASHFRTVVGAESVRSGLTQVTAETVKGGLAPIPDTRCRACPCQLEALARRRPRPGHPPAPLPLFPSVEDRRV